MRYGPGHKAESKNRILAAAAQEIRAKGPNQVAVSELMSAAGLTHGAFYAHFESKEALVAESVSAMFTDAGRRAGGLEDVLAHEDAHLRPALRSFLENYLSPRHRDGPDLGCPLPALAADIARTDSPARKNFVAGMQQMTARMEAALSRLGRARPGAEARAIVAQMVGAVGLARAMGAGTQSDEMLRDCLNSLLEKLGL